jgi:hypothetical protein
MAVIGTNSDCALDLSLLDSVDEDGTGTDMLGMDGCNLAGCGMVFERLSD